MFGEKRTLAEARTQMVKNQLVRRNIKDPRVLQAMGEIPRHRFVEEKLWDSAYKDGPLPIGYGQTISQPYIVSFMTEALKLTADGQAVVLEIGTGSGYQAAILSRLAAKVYSVERIEALAKNAQHILRELEIHNVEIKVSDGGYGWTEHSPYDAIIVTAAAPEIPPPLTVQLKDEGILVAPIGPRYQQELIRLQRRGDQMVQERLVPVAFVPLLGEHGWAD
jgi:protein-L-isoaspartate(D-aspartate) O-methyltransferase